jgi:hypothetical protein
MCKSSTEAGKGRGGSNSMKGNGGKEKRGGREGGKRWTEKTGRLKSLEAKRSKEWG